MPAETAVSARESVNLPIGYLRAFVTLLVIAHHAVLAYHPFAPAALTSLTAEPRWWQVFPVLDPERSTAVALFTGWNDVFFMALMFFLSGLFVARSLVRKGARSFLIDRFRRLGIPFVLAAAIFAPLAYYPSYLGTAAPAGVLGFVREWLSLGNWPAGPAWFLWLLLTFDAAVAGLFVLRPGFAAALERRWSDTMDRPGRCFGTLVAASAAAYLPLAHVFGPLHWAVFGPFTFQTSRLLHYALYFLAGIVVGAHGLDRGLLAVEGRLARRWPLWVGLAVVAYALAIAAALAAVADVAAVGRQVVGGLAFVLSCAASCFALVAVFVRFARTPTKLGESLRDSAYGMYLVHLAFATWLQYALLRLPLSALGKGAAVSLGAVLLSWGTTAALRRLSAVKRIL